VKPRDDEIIAERKSDREAIRKAYMDALGAQRIPAPTTAGDFLRRFERESRVVELQGTLSVARDLVCTWAYMVIASLAGRLKALLPDADPRCEGKPARAAHGVPELPPALRRDPLPDSARRAPPGLPDSRLQPPSGDFPPHVRTHSAPELHLTATRRRDVGPGGVLPPGRWGRY